MRLTKLEQRLEDVQAEMLKEIQRTKSANIERFQKHKDMTKLTKQMIQKVINKIIHNIILREYL